MTNRKITFEFYIDEPLEESTDEHAELSGIEREFGRLRENMEKVFYVEKALFEVASIETHLPS